MGSFQLSLYVRYFQYIQNSSQYNKPHGIPFVEMLARFLSNNEFPIVVQHTSNRCYALKNVNLLSSIRKIERKFKFLQQSSFSLLE